MMNFLKMLKNKYAGWLEIGHKTKWIESLFFSHEKTELENMKTEADRKKVIKLALSVPNNEKLGECKYNKCNNNLHLTH